MNESFKNLPKQIPIFPLSNFVIFPKSTVPLNIFEPRYIQMIGDAIKGNKIIGMVQPKKTPQKIPVLHNIGCAGKITTFEETKDKRYIIILVGIIRFRIIEELNTLKLYRECKVNFDEFSDDLKEKEEKIKFSDLELIFKNLKSLFINEGYIINWKELEKQSLYETINALTMASPFSLEEKQVLLETISLNERKQKLEEILSTYNFDGFNNKTIQ